MDVAKLSVFQLSATRRVLCCSEKELCAHSVCCSCSCSVWKKRGHPTTTQCTSTGSFFSCLVRKSWSRAIDTIFRFNDFVGGPPLKLVKNLPHNCDLSPVFIRGNRLICVFKSFVPKNDNLGDHVIFLEPKHGVNCTRHDFLTRQEKKQPVVRQSTALSQH